jgi:hypothetical protein
MAALATDNFGNDGARAYLALLAAKLVATITEVVNNDERLDPDEDGESMFMPAVELLALLCERYGADPPRPDNVHAWRDRYLAVFDARIARKKKLGAEYKTERRRVIENTFRWLGGLAETHWDEA